MSWALLRGERRNSSRHFGSKKQRWRWFDKFSHQNTHTQQRQAAAHPVARQHSRETTWKLNDTPITVQDLFKKPSAGTEYGRPRDTW